MMALKSLPFFFFGILLIAMFIIIIKRMKNVLNNGIKTIATIVDIVSYTQYGGSRYYVLEYNAQGKIQRVQHNIGGRKIGRREIGKKIDIIYDSKSPKSIVIKNDFSFYVMAFISAILGSGLIVCGFKFLLSTI